ncbi:MAG: 16S rRNA (cytosine(1402)-N(4))-methyltransferase RsmH [Gammaproteobacteria bacterium]
MAVERLGHHPVLLEEALEALAIEPAGVYIDGTFGRGGHSRAILQRLGPEGRLLAIDKDPAAVRVAGDELADDQRFTIQRGSYAMLKRMADEAGVTGRVMGLLLDLGVSSPQLDEAERGFSFLKDGPLDMRMDPDGGPSAAEWLASATEREIARVLKEYGEERYARRIARAIANARARSAIRRTQQLAEIVAAANPKWEAGKHPATRTFQAIRIHINRELEELQAALEQAVEVLAIGGRLVVISFHSLEDRLVKRFIQREARGGDLPPDLPLTQEQIPVRLRAVGRAIRPTEAEIDRNPRSRSATLRVAERI